MPYEARRQRSISRRVRRSAARIWFARRWRSGSGRGRDRLVWFGFGIGLSDVSGWPRVAV